MWLRATTALYGFEISQTQQLTGQRRQRKKNGPDYSRQKNVSENSKTLSKNTSLYLYYLC
jgi:hypothetical protein